MEKELLSLLKPLKCFLLCCLAAMNSPLQPYIPSFYHPLGSTLTSKFGRIPSSLPLYSRILNQTLAVALARLLAREGQTMDSMFDPSQCSPHERMSSFNTMMKMTYMITQQL